MDDLAQIPMGPFNDALGAILVEASGARVVATLEIGPHLHQPYGIVHGGVYSSVIETVASIGAALFTGDGGAVGLSNHTDFLRATTSGTLTFTATPVQQGRQLQLWLVAVTDQDDRPVASGRVRLMNVPASGPVPRTATDDGGREPSNQA